MALSLPELLKKVVELEGSDLHITTSTPPQIRVHGHLQRVEGTDMTASETKQPWSRRGLGASWGR